MSALPTPVLPKRIPHGPHKPSSAIHVSPLLLEAAGCEPEEVLLKLHTSKDGLSGEEAEQRLQQYGQNVVAREERHPDLQLLGKALINPLVILLLVLAGFSCFTGDYRAGGVMLFMVILGVVLRFVQEARADSAAAKLRAMISVHATVLRDVQALAKHVQFEGCSYTRLNAKTPQNAWTLFGQIRLWRVGYRPSDQSGDPTIYPLAMALGLVQGASPALAERAAHLLGATGMTQGQTFGSLNRQARHSSGDKDGPRGATKTAPISSFPTRNKRPRRR